MSRELGIGHVQFRLLKALAESETGTIVGLSSKEMRDAMLVNPEGVPPRFTDKRLRPPDGKMLSSGAGKAAGEEDIDLAVIAQKAMAYK